MVSVLESHLLFFDVCLDSDDAKPTVLKLCGDDATALAEEVDKAKPEDAAATVWKREALVRKGAIRNERE